MKKNLSQSEKNSKKSTYKSPVLVTYGSITQLTYANSMGEMFDGGTGGNKVS